MDPSRSEKRPGWDDDGEHPFLPQLQRGQAAQVLGQDLGSEGSCLLASRTSLGQPTEAGGLLEGQLLHQQVNSGVHFKSMQVVRISLQPHEQPPIGHIGRAVVGGEKQ